METPHAGPSTRQVFVPPRTKVPSTRQVFVPPRTKVSSACTACKKRRSKCSGSQPCSLCIQHATACEFKRLEDRRQRASTCRVLELEKDSALLHSLLGSLKSSSLSSALALLQLIREDASHDRLVSWINSAHERSQSSRPHGAMSIERITDPPLPSRGPAQS